MPIFSLFGLLRKFYGRQTTQESLSGDLILYKLNNKQRMKSANLKKNYIQTIIKTNIRPTLKIQNQKYLDPLYYIYYSLRYIVS